MTGHFAFAYAGPSGQGTSISEADDGIDPAVQYTQIN